uniref:Trithorax group protein osa n=1 Tax=Heterorhabditis bacteriophora TaxID=37862 RepID=A0A1I7WG23_HETBA
MDEGDDYVPQMSQLGDYGAMSGGMGPGQAPPPVYPAMSGGLTPMNNPYEQQMMMMGQPQKPSAADLDPMQSMAAMSNNPMMRPSMQQMSNMYPPQPNQMGMYTPGPPQQSPHYPQSAGYRPGPPQYSTQQGYPMQQPMYPQQRPTGYPPQQPGQPGPYGYPGPQPGYPQPQYPPQMRPQYPQGQQQAPPQSQYWDQQYYQQNPPAAAGIHPQQLPPPQSDQWAQQTSQQVYQIEMEIRSLQQRLQQLYQQQRTPMLEQEMQQLQHRMQYMQAEHQRLQMQGQSSAGGQPLSGQGLTTMPATPSQHPSQIPSSLAHPQAGQPQAQPQQVVIQHQNPATPATPVQVTQSGSQVQVNIKPETSGRTLISVYHRFGESPNGEEVFNEQKDSVPPEPTPTLHHQYQIQAPSTSSHSVHQHHHQQQPSSANGIENGYQSNQILHTHTLSEQKSTVFNTYSSLQGDTNASNVTEGREQKVNVKSQIVEGSPVNTKDTNNLLQSEQAVFDDRDDATPPMRTDTVVVPTEMMSVIPSTDATFTTSAQSDYSIMSDETQPAVEEDEEEKTNEERIEVGYCKLRFRKFVYAFITYYF